MLCPECKRSGERTRIRLDKTICSRHGHRLPPELIIKPPRANKLLYLLFTIALVCIAGLGFSLAGKLPPFISSFVTLISSVIGITWTVIGGIQLQSGYLKRIWHFANKRRFDVAMSILTALVLCAFVFIILDGWYPLLSQHIPYCDNTAGWQVPDNMQEGTSKPDCELISALIMQQNSPTRSHYAELDLNTVNSQSYSQTSFLVKTEISFEEQDKNTFGCLIVQTVNDQPGGYILCVNYLGDWVLQDATNLPNPLQSGIISINTSQTIALMVTVKYGQLSARVNGQEVASIPDTLTSGVVGLIVEDNGQVQSSHVLYTNFELDKAIIG